MSNVSPVLSYKKPSRRSLSPSSSSPSITSSPKLGPSETGTRKVSSRRKALQDFYKIQKNATQKEQKVDADSTEKENDVDITNTKELDNWINTKSIVEVLKLRNSINDELNSQDSENKSIIYNNYYELIKLNKILDDLLRPKVMDKKVDVDSLGIFVDKASNTKYTDDEDYVESKLGELSNFINGKAKKFNTDFESVVKRLQDDRSDDVSISSAVGVMEKEKHLLSDEIDKDMLVKEIDFILQEKLVTEETSGSQLPEEMRDIISKLDPTKDEVLIEQLNALVIKPN